MLECNFRDDMHAACMFLNEFFLVITKHMGEHKQRIERKISGAQELEEKDLRYFVEQYKSAILAIDSFAETLASIQMKLDNYHDNTYEKPRLISRNMFVDRIDEYKTEVEIILAHLCE